ncbi:YceI family protein [Chitinophaga sp. 30R24]|uniref:YceI family protein n=1 Tax=Chitinophaga sp. 30R24 TaxID=3248838 RepID=UPI003B911670
MKTVLTFLYALLLVIICGGPLHAQHYQATDDGSQVKFTIVNHLVFTTTVNGYLKGLKGNITFDPQNLKTAVIDATVKVSTINTGIAKRDRDLLGEKYFNAEKYPVIRILSTSVVSAGKPDTYQLIATLTIKGVTKTVSFPFTAVLVSNACQLNAQFTINRHDFGVGPDNAIDDKLKVSLQVLAKKQ